MPELDVSFMTTDPMLADTFNVLRRADLVDSRGRTTPTVVQTFSGLMGVVTQQDPNDLMRSEDGQTAPRLIFVASPFAFRGVVAGAQPDIIEYQGIQYTVKQVYPYSRFGAGQFEAVAEMMQAVAPS